MSLKDLVRDKGENTLSLSRTIALVTFLALTAGFILACWKRPTEWIFCTYPLGAMIVYVPQLVVKFINQLENIIKAWKGGIE